MLGDREKMLAGLPHKPMDAELTEERDRAKELLHDYNVMTRPGDMAARDRIIRELLGKAGKDVFITQPFYCDYGTYIEVGDYFYTNFNCTILDAGGVKIGNNVLLAPNVGLYTVGHPLDAGLRNQAWEDAKPITIGNNVWIGAHSIILGGVSIGDDCVIAAGSLVTKDIAAGSLAMGSPCKVVRSITEADREQYLARICDAG
ncbi:MAG: sugar O-acetyltransferase [Neisseria sp.]|uniref:sugar O-acetyltransferase n=1 Tax=Neisseria sp. TaxID=192066 RepID=UPI0026DA81BE|nr:sugar O-acetyltransferase [Neisseria sp.]MDO4248572.1 sugar O-acetyltransferase [Neisseria sp.]